MRLLTAAATFRDIARIPLPVTPVTRIDEIQAQLEKRRKRMEGDTA